MYKFKIIIFSFAVLAALATVASASGAISQGFIADEEFDEGVIVSFDAERSGYVVKANTQNVERLAGVVVDEDTALLDISGEESTVRVATQGEIDVLVSTSNGSIDAGDSITASHINGIGHKATGNTRVVGVALESFSEESEGGETIALDEEDPAYVGKIRMSVSVHDEMFDSQDVNVVLGTLQTAAEAVVGQEVSLPKAISAVFVVFSAMIVVAIILLSSVRGTIISLGRNPFAKKTIMRSLFKFILVSIVVLAASVGVAYLILIS